MSPVEIFGRQQLGQHAFQQILRCQSTQLEFHGQTRRKLHHVVIEKWRARFV